MGFFDRFKKKNKAKAAEPAKAEEAPKAAAAAPAPAKAAVANAGQPTSKTGFNPYPAADLGELLPPAPAGGKIKIAIYWTAA